MTGKPIYNITKEQLEADIEAGLSNAAMAEKYGCGTSTIQHRRTKYNLRADRHITTVPGECGKKMQVRRPNLDMDTLPDFDPSAEEFDIAAFCRIAAATGWRFSK